MDLLTRITEIFKKADKISDKHAVNLSRKKFIALFIMGLIDCRDVCFKEVAASMPNQTKTDSNLRRIQDFFANYQLDYGQMALVLSLFLPKGHQIYLSMDRTNWRFGEKEINFLVITAYCRGTGIPLWFEPLPEQDKGNSSEYDRMRVLKPLIDLFAASHRIVLTADREFIGEGWIGYLLRKRVRFFIRLRNNIHLDRKGERKNAREWLGNKRVCLLDDVSIYGTSLSVGIKKDKKGEDPITVLTNHFALTAVCTYQRRWSIETFFQSIKERGFRLENTHLKHDARLRKLFAMVSLTFAVCLWTGIWLDQNLKKIRVKNHGYKENSYFRHGIDKIREMLRIDHLSHIFDELMYYIEKIFDDVIELNFNIKKILM
jgi:hypothetical protein